MKTSAQPADARASRIFGTVKNRMMMCGSPAVPIMSAAVIATTSRRGREPPVNRPKPEVGADAVERVEEVAPRRDAEQRRALRAEPVAEPERRHRVAGEEQGDEDRRHEERDDDHEVLRTCTCVMPFIPPSTAYRNTAATATPIAAADGHLEEPGEHDARRRGSGRRRT